jgi:hypothetical protein
VLAVTTLDDDIDLARTWWLGLAPSIPSDVRGLWFGLFVTTSTSPNEHQMYVGGTPTFATRDGGDWACDYIWQPDARYLHLPGLAAIPTTDWQSALDHAVMVVTTVGPWQSAPGDVAGVGVGFDDGDVVIVWTRP